MRQENVRYEDISKPLKSARTRYLFRTECRSHLPGPVGAGKVCFERNRATQLRECMRDGRLDIEVGLIDGCVTSKASRMASLWSGPFPPSSMARQPRTQKRRCHDVDIEGYTSS